MTGSHATKSRIAFKIGTPISSSRPAPATRPAPPSTLGKRPRPKLHHADSDSEDDDGASGAPETTTVIDNDSAVTEGARDVRSSRQPLTIPRQENHWKSRLSSKRTVAAGSSRPISEQSRPTEKAIEPNDLDKPLKWGLSVRAQSPGQEHSASLDQKEDISDVVPRRNIEGTAEKSDSRTADEEALDALVGTDAPKKGLVIHQAASRVQEDSTFQRDFRQAPDAPSLDDYDEMPVEEFGAALLRGMGWDGKPGEKPKEVKRRPNQMGLGSSRLKGEEDLGSWNQGANGSRSRPPKPSDYNRQERTRDRRRNHDGSGERQLSYKEERDRERRDGRVKDTHRHRTR